MRLKVTDNGLSRDLFPDDYHCLGDNENRPVKWMAPETLLQGHYTTASDVVGDTLPYSPLAIFLIILGEPRVAYHLVETMIFL